MESSGRYQAGQAFPPTYLTFIMEAGAAEVTGFFLRLLSEQGGRTRHPDTTRFSTG